MGNVYDIIEGYMKYKNKHFKIIEKEYENNFMIIETRMKKKKKFVNEKLSQLPIHHLIKQIKSDELLWDFDAVSLYPSAMWDENSFYPRIETGYAYTRDTNDELIQQFNT